jgi:diaminopimelate decarboxylase
MFHFAHDARGVLLGEGVDLREIADRVGTPTYVYSQATIARHYRVFDQAFAGHPHLICYAMKANSTRAVLAQLGRLGSGADIVSGGELERALAAGIPADRIVFSGVGKTEAEMARALAAKIRTFNVESEPELELLDRVARDLGVSAPVSLRVNPDVDPKTHPYIATGLAASKFGVPIGEVPRIAQGMRERRGVRLVGVDCHIGSQLLSLDPLLQALESVLAMVDRLKSAGHPIHDVDLGGGLGIAYRDLRSDGGPAFQEDGHGSKAAPPEPRELGAEVLRRMRGRSETLVLEPGRVIVGNAGLLLARVLYVKPTASKTFVILDAAMNDLIRPALYGAHHEIWPVVQPKDGASFTADVVGPVCESSDAFARDRSLPRVQAGDLVAVMSAGAYGFAMASTYNSRPLAAEVMVSGGRWETIRPRQPLEAISAGETIPDFVTADPKEDIR